MTYHVALSYAGEDRIFVEHLAAILKQYLGHQAVFHYTSGSKKMNIRGFFEFINSCLADEDGVSSRDAVFTICFVRQVDGSNRIVTGQQTELLDPDESSGVSTSISGLKTWQSVTNCRTASRMRVKTIAVVLPNHRLPAQKLKQWSVPFDLNCFGQATMLCQSATDIDQASSEYVAEVILRDILELNPITHACKAFTYEKDTISFYADVLRALREKPFPDLPESTRQCLSQSFNSGVPLVWPSTRLRTDLKLDDNALLQEGAIGAERPGMRSLFSNERNRKGDTDRVVVSSALSQHHECHALEVTPDACMIRSALSFLEAGPREKIMAKRAEVGIVVCGGIAPGVNAVIDGIVRRHHAYDSNSRVYGFRYGLRALSQVSQKMQDYRILLSEDGKMPNSLGTADHVSQGGSVLGTFRLDRLDDAKNGDLLNHVLSNIEGLDILYVIGGDGSMKAANLLSQEVRTRRIPVSIVGIPKTMDNDILWVWQSFGFATAVEKAREIIDCLSTEVQSNPRICVLQLFGSVSGFVVSHAVLSSRSGQCDAALIPEAHFTIKGLAETLLKRYRDDGGKIDPSQLPWGMVVMAETAIPDDANNYVFEAGLSGDELAALSAYQSQDVYLDGQTSDELRAASLKLVVYGIEKELGRYFDKVRIFSNEPRHILRASNPSFSDIITGQRLGSLAVDNAMAGYAGFMVSQWLTEFVLVPLRMVSLGRKRIPESGIFWKSVWAKTEQGLLVSPGMNKNSDHTNSTGKTKGRRSNKKSTTNESNATSG